jgi:hypothetical protein
MLFLLVLLPAATESQLNCLFKDVLNEVLENVIFLPQFPFAWSVCLYKYIYVMNISDTRLILFACEDMLNDPAFTPEYTRGSLKSKTCQSLDIYFLIIYKMLKRLVPRTHASTHTYTKSPRL